MAALPCSPATLPPCKSWIWPPAPVRAPPPACAPTCCSCPTTAAATHPPTPFCKPCAPCTPSPRLAGATASATPPRKHWRAMPATASPPPLPPTAAQPSGKAGSLRNCNANASTKNGNGPGARGLKKKMKPCKPWKQAMEKRLTGKRPNKTDGARHPLSSEMLQKEEQIQTSRNPGSAQFSRTYCYQ